MSVLAQTYRLLTGTERWRAAVVLAMVVVGMALEAASVGVVVPAIALLSQPEATAASGWVRRIAGGRTGSDLLLFGAGLLVLLYAVKTGFMAALAAAQMRFVFDLQARISRQLFERYLHQPYAFHLERNSAHLVRNATTEVALFTNVALDLIHLTTESSIIVGIAVLLLLVEPVGAVTVVVSVAAAGWSFYRVVRARSTRWGWARQQHEGMRIQHLQQGLGGVKEVKLSGREAYFLDRYAEHNAACAEVWRKQQVLLQLPRLWMELLAVVGLSGLTTTLVLQGQETTRVMAMLGLFGAAAFRLMPSANRIVVIVQSLRYAIPVVSLISRELGTPAPSSPAPEVGWTFDSEIELQDVSFQYTEVSAHAVDGVSLRVFKNESVGFIGPSGAGKSTLVDLMLGLLTPTQGAVLVDGRDIREAPSAWQRQIGYVPQTMFLTDDTLRRNVAFGVPDGQIDDAMVWRALAAAQLDGFVRTLPDGLESLVGERGIRLSGGQRQRIGIARALYRDPPVLVLDEATSALDADTERGVMDAVESLHGQKTIIVVAHRTSTVERCDRLYRLEAGRVVAHGTSRELLQSIHVSRGQ